jgi:hypothetical protein
MGKHTIRLFSLLLIVGCSAQRPAMNQSPSPVVQEKNNAKFTDPFLDSLLHQYPEYFDTLLTNNNRWQIKIIYTQIDRNELNEPTFKRFQFNNDPDQYFYPASTVKMPVSFLALQKLNDLNIPGLNRNSTMVTEKGFNGRPPVFNDPGSIDGRPSVEQYIRRIFLVSDNEAFNRLYEFLGQEYINKSLHSMGYDSVQILHRLDISLTEEENRHTNPVKFYNGNRLLYQQPLIRSELVYQTRHTFLGNGFFKNGSLVNSPFDFSMKNRFTLSDLTQIIQSVIFPSVFPAGQKFHLTDSDYNFLYRYMSMKPHESDFPSYDSSYSDAYSKLLLYGGKGDLDPDIRIFNKEGDAYGFLTDIAYIVDFKNGVEFFLSANIYCNSDGNFNDDNYDYDNVGYPFLKHLGEVIYQYELKRKKLIMPDLSKFKINYSK